MISIYVPELEEDDRVPLPRGVTKTGVTGLFVASPDLAVRRNATLTAAYYDRNPGRSTNQQELVSASINVTLADGRGNPITKLDSALTICLTPSNSSIKSDDVCLSYYDEEKGRWECEDKCLATISNKGILQATHKENLGGGGNN